ncbi:hypothetical protein CFBP6625_04720 [Agrobacterium tumefaciens]|nr:hypothetical protein CFBP6625_04720 [Agrobacterium tumefaciens]
MLFAGCGHFTDCDTRQVSDLCMLRGRAGGFCVTRCLALLMNSSPKQPHRRRMHGSPLYGGAFFSSKDGLFCRLFRLKFALVSGPRVYQLNAGIDVKTEKEFHELTEWLTATFQIWISIDLQNNFLKIRFA